MIKRLIDNINKEVLRDLIEEILFEIYKFDRGWRPSVTFKPSWTKSFLENLTINNSKNQIKKKEMVII